MHYLYTLENGLTPIKTNTKKYIISAIACAGLVLGLAVPVLAVPSGARVKNDNANRNACWGQDRAYYASQGYFVDNMDIKQSFPSSVGEQRAAWAATYCESHGPVN